MPHDPFTIKATDHAVGRYRRLVPAGALAPCDDEARDEIRGLVRSGASTAEPPWGCLDSDARRYLAFGQGRALVLDRQQTADGQQKILVQTVVTLRRPGMESGL